MKARTTLCWLLLLALVAASAGCETAHGFGKDMEKAGEKIQEKTE